MTPGEEIERARRAQELLDNELLASALAAIETEVVEQWAACPARDKEGKEALWQLMKTSHKFRALLRGYVDTGKLATEQLRRFEEQRSLWQRMKAA